jgi:hypothetical protein
MTYSMQSVRSQDKAKNSPAILPPAIPPLSVGLPCWLGAQLTGPGLVVFSVWLMGYVSIPAGVALNNGEDEFVLL